MFRALPPAIVLLLIAFAPSTQAAGPLPEVAVTTCGQIVPPKTLGYLTGNPYPTVWANEEWKFLEVSTPLELSLLALLWWYRDVFVR